MRKIELIQQSPNLLRRIIGAFGGPIGSALKNIGEGNFTMKKLTDKDASKELFNNLYSQAYMISRFNDTLFDIFKYKELEDEAQYLDFFDNLIYRKGKRYFGLYTYSKFPTRLKHVFYFPNSRGEIGLCIYSSSLEFPEILERGWNRTFNEREKRKLRKCLARVEFFNLLYFEFNEVYDKFLKGSKLYAHEIKRNSEIFRRVKDGILETIENERKPEEESIEIRMLIDSMFYFIDSDNERRNLEKLFKKGKYAEIKEKLFSVFCESLKPILKSGDIYWVSNISLDPLGIKAKDVTIGISKLDEDKGYVDELENLFKEYENLYKKKRFDYEKCFEVENKILEAYKEDSYWKVGFDR